MRWGKRRRTSARVTIRTHEACLRIIDKQGPLNNEADRDHCIQYMVAVPLIFGRLTAEDYEDDVAKDARIDELRAKIVCVEDPTYTADYHDPEKRSIANALTVELNDGSTLPEVAVAYPIGHRLRREDGIPLLLEKFERNLRRKLSDAMRLKVMDVCRKQDLLEAMAVDEFVGMFVEGRG